MEIFKYKETMKELDGEHMHTYYLDSVINIYHMCFITYLFLIPYVFLYFSSMHFKVYYRLDTLPPK